MEYPHSSQWLPMYMLLHGISLSLIPIFRWTKTKKAELGGSASHPTERPVSKLRAVRFTVLRESKVSGLCCHEETRGCSGKHGGFASAAAMFFFSKSYLGWESMRKYSILLPFFAMFEAMWMSSTHVWSHVGGKSCLGSEFPVSYSGSWVTSAWLTGAKGIRIIRIITRRPRPRRLSC